MADPGFPRGGGANSPGGRQHTILLNFPTTPSYRVKLVTMGIHQTRCFARWGRQPSGWGGGAPTYNFAKFSQKLHEIERIWTPGRKGASLVPPLDPPLIWYFYRKRESVYIVAELGNNVYSSGKSATFFPLVKTFLLSFSEHITKYEGNLQPQRG